jgi:hypothetical protein
MVPGVGKPTAAQRHAFIAGLGGLPGPVAAFTSPTAESRPSAANLPNDNALPPGVLLAGISGATTSWTT